VLIVPDCTDNWQSESMGVFTQFYFNAVSIRIELEIQTLGIIFLEED